jgi:hypothetical protein
MAAEVQKAYAANREGVLAISNTESIGFANLTSEAQTSVEGDLPIDSRFKTSDALIGS